MTKNSNDILDHKDPCAMAEGPFGKLKARALDVSAFKNLVATLLASE